MGRLIIITTILTTIAIGIVAIIYYSQQMVEVTNYYPKERMEANYGPINIELSSWVVPSDLMIAIKPVVNGNVKMSGKTFSFEPSEPFAYEELYSVNVYFKGDLIKEFDFMGPELTSDQNVLEENAQSVATYFPLAHVLPYKDDNLSMQYKQKLTIEVTVINPEFDYQEFVKHFVENQGVEYESHEYIYNK